MTEVTLPSSLAFLVSNFHSLVNIKLDASNYLLWRIQVVNVMDANGFLGYLDGSVPVPSKKIQGTNGAEVDNPEYKLWKLIDSQLLSCLTASLSQSTLPYVLGLHQAKQVWDSLSTRYNYLSENHAQELRTQLYNHTKTSTIASYIDKIKEISQKLAATGSPVDDEELVFHTLRGLPPIFNGLKTAVRAFGSKGTKLSFDEVVTLLNSEDVQLLQDSGPDLDKSTILVTTPSHQMSQSDTASDNVHKSEMSTVPKQGTTANHMSYGYGQPMPAFNNFYPQVQQNPGNFRNFSKGRGGRGARYPREPCAICGRTNHVTAYCYYKSSFPIVDVSGAQWRGTMVPPQSFYSPISAQPQQFGGFTSGQPISSPVISQAHFAGIPYQFVPSSSHVPQAQFAAGVPGNQNMCSYSANGPYGVSTPNCGQFGQLSINGSFSPGVGQSEMKMAGPSSGINSTAYVTTQPQQFNVPYTSGSQPWFFDSGATNHVTNNLQNVNQPQQSLVSEGVMVGNGSSLQVAHTGTGQEYSENSVQRAMSQGFVSHPELL